MSYSIYAFVPLVTVRNLDLKSISVLPAEAYSILIVHSNTMLPGTIAVKSLQVVSRRYFEVLESNRSIDD